MTELNLAYGFTEDELKEPTQPIKKQKQQPQMEQPSPPQFQQQQPQMQVADVPSYKYKQPKTESYSFWDRMTMSRTDVMKLASFSLVILLAIAFDKIITYYITKYLSDNILTTVQDFLVRLSYPIAVFLILWIIKSL